MNNRSKELKGGEKVQIGGLGFINTIAVNGKTPPAINGLDFAGLLGSLMGSSCTTQKSDSLKSTLMQLPNQEANELLDFLKKDDIFELNGGHELLNQVVTSDSTELLSIIKDFLGLDDQSLKDLITRLQSFVSTEKGIMADTKSSIEKSSENNVEPVPEKAVESEAFEIESMIACLNQILTLPVQEFPKVLNQDFKEVVKAVKLFELLGKNQDRTMKNSRITEVIQQTVQKLEVLMDQTKASVRADYLQKTFSSVQSELQTLRPSENGLEKNLPTVKPDSATGMVHLQQMTKPEQLIVMLDKSGKPVSTEQLIQQFSNILSKSQFSNKEGTQKLFIKLNPENLGTLRIELIQKDSTIVAKILTTNGTAKDVLESQLQGLKHSFSMQNIHVDRIEITQQFTNPQERFFHRDQQHDHQPREEQAQKEQQDDGEFNQSFEEALLNIEV
jgi:flagellar hook-length control protein FliK